MSRIKLGDNGLEMIVKMSDGNHEAIQALMAIVVESSMINPQDNSSAIVAMLTMDTYQIYGTNICVLYNDKCQRNIGKLLMLLGACHLGVIPESKLQSLACDRTCEIEFTDAEFSDLDAKMREKVAGFQRPPANNSERPN